MSEEKPDISPDEEEPMQESADTLNYPLRINKIHEAIMTNATSDSPDGTLHESLMRQQLTFYMCQEIQMLRREIYFLRQQLAEPPKPNLMGGIN